MIVKTEDSKFVRDTSSMALLATDKSGREEYYTRTRALTAQRTEINTIKDSISSVQDEVMEIKRLLQQLIKT